MRENLEINNGEYMEQYYYVGKNEYKGFKAKILEIIHKLQKHLKASAGYAFTIRSAGSAKLNLVTCSSDGGYDLDYQLVLQHCEEDDPETIREDFIEAACEIAKKLHFTVENKVHVLKITMRDNESAGILSCDMAIVRENAEYEEIIVHDKKSNRYFWNKLPTFKKIVEKQELIKRQGFWDKFREEYLELKNNNNVKSKHSYQLRIEATNNIWKQYF